MYGMEDGVGILLEEAAVEDSSASHSTLIKILFRQITFEHAHQIKDHSCEISLKIAKETLWQQSLTFYKELKMSEEQHRDITKEFDGEE